MIYKKKILPALIFLATIPLTGCEMFNQDGIDTKPRHFVIPTYNSASETPPYTRVMGNPIPDLGWTRERTSECNPWYPGENGCPKTSGNENTEKEYHYTDENKHIAKTTKKNTRRKYRGS